MVETANGKSRKKQLRVKVISMGNAESGKSCIIKRYCEKRFINKYIPTVGIDYGVTKVNIKDTEVKVNIFDMSGHPFFFEVRNEFYKDTQAAILVYDVTSRSSFESLNGWLEEMKEEMSKDEFGDVEFFIVSNKTDLNQRSRVDPIEARLWAEGRGYKFFEVSAATGKNISHLFEQVFTTLLDKHHNFNKSANQQPAQQGWTNEQAEAIIRIRNGRDHHEKLGVSPHATKSEINKAYKKLAILLHPDKNVAPGSVDAFKTLVNARTALMQGK